MGIGSRSPEILPASREAYIEEAQRAYIAGAIEAEQLEEAVEAALEGRALRVPWLSPFRPPADQMERVLQ